MNSHYGNAKETMIKGWTRIDMLLALYDRTIENIQTAKAAYESGESNLYVDARIAASQCILGLHSGLDTQEESAQNVARLLHFVAVRLEEDNFDEAILFLRKLRGTFAQIRTEASTLEREGKLPSFEANTSFNKTA